MKKNKTLLGEVKEAVILAGGINSRMLPISKIIPKAMLPVRGKIAIEYLIEECLNSGISKIYIVVGEENSLIQKYFTADKKLNDLLKKNNKLNALERLEKTELLNKYLEFVVQNSPKGEADALMQVINRMEGNRPIAILLGDMIIDKNKTPVTKQLLLKAINGKHLILSDGRLILTEKGMRLYRERCGSDQKLDLRIMDLFSEEEKVIFNVEGREVKLGSLEEYAKMFSV